jgi:hypothetical protein
VDGGRRKEEMGKDHSRKKRNPMVKFVKQNKTKQNKKLRAESW